MATREEPAVFQAKVNLVLVPVVIRDRKGQAIGALKQSDFQLFDRNKPQAITRFSVEQPRFPATRKDDPSPNPAAPSAHAPATSSATTGAPVAGQPERFFSYLFDDIHLPFSDFARVRDAADRNMSRMLSSDRAAIFTTSGQTELDFTDDKDRLHTTLLSMRPQPSQQDLPGDYRTRLSLLALRDGVRRLALKPGQRTIILVSPGFLTMPDYLTEKVEVMDRAIRAKVIINSLDARGLYTPVRDISLPGRPIMNSVERQTATLQADVLAELALGTGGVFFQNSNDLDEGFRRTASAPEYIYLLGFSPQNLKMDGSFHSLKVSLKNPNSLTVTGLEVNARHGYYAPTRLADAKETARREIEEALFSREELHDIPVDLHSQFFKLNQQQAKVSVLVRVDMQRLRFHKENDRNRNDLTVVVGLFDHFGNYQGGVSKQIEMRLKDDTVKKLAAGLSIRTTLDAKPGRYAIRIVVRDSEGQMMAAQNGAVDIPY